MELSLALVNYINRMPKPTARGVYMLSDSQRYRDCAIVRESQCIKEPTLIKTVVHIFQICFSHPHRVFLSCQNFLLSALKSPAWAWTDLVPYLLPLLWFVNMSRLPQAPPPPLLPIPPAFKSSFEVCLITRIHRTHDYFTSIDDIICNCIN